MPESKAKKEPCKHSVLRPTGTTYDVPGSKIDGAEICLCINCETSKTLHIKPFVFPQLKKKST